ncbi:thioredoxin family protein [Nitratifractor sp.]
MVKKIGFALGLGCLLLAGCADEGRSEAQKIASAPANSQTVRAEAASGTSDSAAKATQQAASGRSRQAPVADSSTKESASVAPFYRVFKDGASIDPAGKPMLLVFGQSADPYTRRLQKDLEEHPDLARRIRADVTPIYLDATANKRHKFMHSGQMMDVDTKTLLGIYRIEATPTLIFTDPQGKTIFIVPGYMPPKQFTATLDFIKEGAWRGKDRQNGEIYRALKAYYEAHGVPIGGKKK